MSELNTCMSCKSRSVINDDDETPSFLRCLKYNFSIGTPEDASKLTCDSHSAARESKIKTLVNFREVKTNEDK